MDKDTTNAVRQVMMNELGLTRESIRAEMESIVEKTVKAHISSINFDKMFDLIIRKTIEPHYNNVSAIDTMVRRIVVETVTKHITNTLSIKGSVDISNAKEI